MERELLVWFCWFLTVCDCLTSTNTKYVKGVINTKQNYLDTNFESGSLSPWMDKSDDQTVVRWIVEDFWTISPSLRPPPLEPIGSSNRKYLRLERQFRGSFGVAVLQSPFFLCQPGDVLTFSYWIRSRYNQWNNLQVFWSKSDGAEKLLVDLSTSSQIENNRKWNVASQLIPIQTATEIRLTFYGFCATDDLDAIAIDDIKVMTSELMSTTAFTTSPLATTNPDLSTEITPENTDASSETTNNEALTTETQEETSKITDMDQEGTTDGTTTDTTKNSIETTSETGELTSEVTTETTASLEETTTEITAIVTELSSSPATDGTSESENTATSEVTLTSETTDATTNEVSSSPITDGTTEFELTTIKEDVTTESETWATTDEMTSSPITDETTEGDITTSSTPQSTPVTVPSTFTCPNPVGTFFYAAGTCLPYYYRCVNGTANVENCQIEGTFFNPGINGCAIPNLIDGCASTAVPTTSSTSLASFSCPPATGTALYPVSGSCIRYYVCFNGILNVIAQCPTGEVFNPDIEFCTAPTEAGVPVECTASSFFSLI